MNKTKQKILLFFLFSFSVYCALIIGQSWDEIPHFIYAKVTLNYLFSLGSLNEEILYREFHSTLYWSLQYLLTKVFPSQYIIEVGHLINLFFSFSTIIGIGKIAKELFNKNVGKIVFLILFFYPIFFGHMSFNSSDTILAFSHVWIFYLILKYLKNQNIKHKVNNYILFMGVLTALASGIQLFFLGSLIPIFLFVLAEIFLIKKFTIKKFNKKKFLYDSFNSGFSRFFGAYFHFLTKNYAR